MEEGEARERHVQRDPREKKKAVQKRAKAGDYGQQQGSGWWRKHVSISQVAPSALGCLLWPPPFCVRGARAGGQGGRRAPRRGGGREEAEGEKGRESGERGNSGERRVTEIDHSHFVVPLGIGLFGLIASRGRQRSVGAFGRRTALEVRGRARGKKAGKDEGRKKKRNSISDLSLVFLPLSLFLYLCSYWHRSGSFLPCGSKHTHRRRTRRWRGRRASASGTSGGRARAGPLLPPSAPRFPRRTAWRARGGESDEGEGKVPGQMESEKTKEVH